MRSLFALITLSAFCLGCALPRCEYSRTVQQSLETDPLTSIEVNSFNGAITVEPHDLPTLDMEITYKAYGETEEAAQTNCEQLDCEISIENGQLKIVANKPADHWSSSATFKLKAPPNCALTLVTSNGAISASSMQASVDAHTSNGSIHLQNILESVAARTSNGSIQLEDCRGCIDLKTSNGKVTYSGDLLGTENKIQTSNGRVEIQLKPESLIEILTKTSNGSIKCELPTQRVLVDKKHEYHALVGSGDEQLASKLDIRTSNGSIKIEAIPEQAPTGSEAEIGSEVSVAL